MIKSKIDVISREIAARQVELDAFLQSEETKKEGEEEFIIDSVYLERIKLENSSPKRVELTSKLLRFWQIRWNEKYESLNLDGLLHLSNDMFNIKAHYIEDGSSSLTEIRYIIFICPHQRYKPMTWEEQRTIIYSVIIAVQRMYGFEWND